MSKVMIPAHQRLRCSLPALLATPMITTLVAGEGEREALARIGLISLTFEHRSQSALLISEPPEGRSHDSELGRFIHDEHQ